MRSLRTLPVILGLSLLVTGCPPMGGGGGGTDNDNDAMPNENIADDDNENDNEGDDGVNANDDGDGPNDNGTMGGGTTTLDTISFDGNDVAFGEGPVTYAIGGGFVTFVNGDVGTRGFTPLYGDGFSSWNVDVEDSLSMITFTDLQVTSVLLYFAHTGSAGATVTPIDEHGVAIGSPLASVATTTLGDPAGFINVEASDEAIIAGLLIQFDEGADAGDVVAADTMTLTVLDP